MRSGESWRQAATSTASGEDAGERLGELRTAVLSGRWDQVTALAGSIIPAGESEVLLLAELTAQAALHALAVPALTVPAPTVPALTVQAAGPGGQLSRAVLRSLAAIDGDRGWAVALLRAGIPPADSSHPGQAVLPRVDVQDLVRSRSPGAPLRLIGVARPAEGGALALGDAGSADEVTVAGAVRQLARGTPVELIGRWDSRSGRFDCASLVTLGQVPDYAAACRAVLQLCATAGLAAEPLDVRVVSSGELDENVARARRRRRLLEWNDLLTAAGLLEDALSTSQLSLAALARAHKIIVGAATAGAGQLRQTPAVIRWRRVITYRAPPVAAARSLTGQYLSDLAAELTRDDAARHPATLAAEAVAALTTSHPFADGNGRVARAVATWLLLRSGFRRRSDETLSTFLDGHLEEHFRVLRTFHVSPWAWHQLCYDAVLMTFERAAAPGGQEHRTATDAESASLIRAGRPLHGPLPC